MSQDLTYLDSWGATDSDQVYLSSYFFYTTGDSYINPFYGNRYFKVQDIWKKYFYWRKIEDFFAEYYNEVVLNEDIESKKQKLKEHYLECLRKSKAWEKSYKELIITTWMEAKKYLHWLEYSQNIIFDARFCNAEEILEAYDLAIEMWYSPKIEANITAVAMTASIYSMPAEREKLKKVHEEYLWELLRLYKLRPKLKIKLIFMCNECKLFAFPIAKRYVKNFLNWMIKEDEFIDTYSPRYFKYEK